MKLVFTTESVAQMRTPIVIVPYVKGGANKGVAAVDKLTRGALKKKVQGMHFKGIAETRLEFDAHSRPLGARKFVLVGVGARPDASSWRLGVASALAVARREKCREVGLWLDEDNAEVLEWCAEGLAMGAYRFDSHRTSSPGRFPRVARIGTLVQNRSLSACRKSLKRGNRVAAAVNSCRDLVNEPANHLDVPTFVRRAKEIAGDGGVRVKVLGKAALAKGGFGLIEAVGQGATTDPALLHLVYGDPKAPCRVALVGKGIVFDSGGLCIKPAGGMQEMKTDMAGAAVVLSVMGALQDLGVALRVDAFIPLAENAVGSGAMRPGDVLTSHKGLTVEVTNTDAEGRLVLADALSFAAESKPEMVVDLATLTGACSVALGRKRAALYCDDEGLAGEWLEASRTAGERLWRMPLAEELAIELKSEVADLKNSGGRFGGSISAALFLQRFVSTRRWVHLDIAGPARNASGHVLCPKGGSGFGVLTVLEYLRNM